tara:strand:- start:1045 stop:1176 length:132 start_codon:yes stop_codon:yes gene_type:complete
MLKLPRFALITQPDKTAIRHERLLTQQALSIYDFDSRGVIPQD